jgi:hypothetical protein
MLQLCDKAFSHYNWIKTRRNQPRSEDAVKHNRRRQPCHRLPGEFKMMLPPAGRVRAWNEK